MPPWIRKLLVPVNKDGHEFISRTQGYVQIRKIDKPYYISEKNRKSHLPASAANAFDTIPCNC